MKKTPIKGTLRPTPIPETEDMRIVDKRHAYFRPVSIPFFPESKKRTRNKRCEREENLPSQETG